METTMASATNTGPQIRSRITVVCAECKRLKLKCDRRAPCGSCTKRDTVVRCIYSPAAAEKVDLHSLNNRLIQVESTLALITSGQTPPAFQPTYPFSLPPGPGSASSSSSTSQPAFTAHHHHHHYAVTPSSSQSLTLSERDIKAIWLDDLQAHLNLEVHSKGKQKLRDPDVKLEPTLDFDIDFPIHIDDDDDTPTKSSLFSSSATQRRCSVPPSHPQQLLPALSIYYPVPTIPPPDSTPIGDAAFPQTHYPSQPNPSFNGFPHPQPQKDFTKPQITPALLALLPGGERCREMLMSAKEVFRLRPVPFLPPFFFPSESSGGGGKRRKLLSRSDAASEDAVVTEDDEEKDELEDEDAWRIFERRCLGVLGLDTGMLDSSSRSRGERDADFGGKNTNRDARDKEKEKMREQKRRAREIYFAGVVGSSGAGPPDRHIRASSAAKEDANANAKSEESLAFFALMCAVLAVGASPNSNASPTSTNPTSTSNPRAITHSHSPEFLFALSQQAIGVWDTHLSTGPSAFTSTTSTNGNSKEKDELDKMDNLLACLVGVVYLLCERGSCIRARGRDERAYEEEGEEEEEQEEEEEEGSGRSEEKDRVTAVVGKMVNAARNMGLGRDTPQRTGTNGHYSGRGKGKTAKDVSTSSSTTHPTGSTTVPSTIPNKEHKFFTAESTKKEKDVKETREEKKEEWRRIIWWDVLFYDLFTADAFGQQPYLPAYSYSVRSLPNPISSGPSLLGELQHKDLAGETTTTTVIDVSHSGMEGEMNLDNEAGAGNTGGGLTFVTDQGLGHASQKADEGTGLNRKRKGLDKEKRAKGKKVYLIARCRLTSLAQRVLHALAHPSCCCGYTLDQALALEGELRFWSSSLPTSLKADSLQDESTNEKDPMQIYAAELALVSYLLAIKIWSPFLLRSSSSENHGPAIPNQTASTAMTMSGHATMASLQAACGLLKAVKVLSPSSTSGSEKNLTPTACSFFPISKMAWDALVICARVSVSSSPPSSFLFEDSGSHKSKDIPTEIRSGLHVLANLQDGSLSLKETERQVADGIYRLIVHGIGARPSRPVLGALDVGCKSPIEQRGKKRKNDEVERDLSTPVRTGTGPSFVHGHGGDAGFEYPSLGQGQHSQQASDAYLDQTDINAFASSEQQYHHDTPRAQQHSFTNVYEYPPQAQERQQYVTTSPSVPQTPHPTQRVYPATTPTDPDLAAAVIATVKAKRHSLVESTKEKQDKDKDKDKERRRKSPVYPVVGIRLRTDKDGQPVVRPRSGTHSHSLSNSGSPNNTTKGSMQAPGPLMTSTPRPLPSQSGMADRVLQYQQQQKQKVFGNHPAPTDGVSQPAEPAREGVDPYRSRSSSLSMGLGPMNQPSLPQQQQQRPQQHHQTQIEYSNFTMLEMDMQHQQEPDERQHAYQPSAHAFDHARQQVSYEPSSQHPSFDVTHPHNNTGHLVNEMHHGHSGASNSFNPPPPSATYASHSANAVSSPFSNPSNAVASPFSSGSPNGPLSATGSPFASNTINASTAFGNIGQPPHLNPPIYGPHPPPASTNSDASSNPSGSPTTYYRNPHPFSTFPNPSPDSTMSGHHPQDIILDGSGGMRMDGEGNILDSVPQSLVYEKPGMFDGVGAHQHQRMIQGQPPGPTHPSHGGPTGSVYENQADQEYSNEQHHLSVMSSMDHASSVTSSAWPVQTLQQPQPHQPQPTNPYWNNGTEFKFLY